MATGLEAVGAASAVIQLISFAGTLVSLTFQIYNGRPTPENELEEYAAKMSDAANRVQIRVRQVPQMIPEEKKLFKVAQECVAAAESLRKEAQSITKGYRKGRVLKAVIGAIRTDYHKKKIQNLDLCLKRCKGILETELLQKICNKSDAVEQQQSQGFQKLDSDIQNLITQIASGNVKIEDLLVQESKATRDMIITSLASEFNSFDVRTVTEAQRQCLLKSLKSEDIRKRYNEVMSPSDACFERVFASYERVCSKDPKHKAWSNINEASYFRKSEQLLEEEVDEIDESWDTFCSWLRSNDDIFWVQGKPGSGKSTLMKFIIDSDNTNRLLNSWNQNVRVLSYFFWKIGSESQNSIKGLLCSLLHDILSDDNGATDNVVNQFTFSQSKDYYNEWSTEEVDEVLFSLLRTSSRSTCIFIDGLDEISDKDGFRALMSIVERLWSYPKVKLCTSSRPETELLFKFETMRTPSLRLDDLTRPEMAIYIHNELDPFSAQISSLIFEQFKDILLQKAQGVFLWLFLATNSLTNGIENCDDEKVLFDRLKELPGELEDLYKAMWLRLGANNQVYRETATKYFNCVVYGGWDYDISCSDSSTWIGNHTPSLAHLSLVTRTRSQILFPPRPQKEDLKWLNILCDRTADDIKSRCAGMLRIGSQSVDIGDEEIHFPSEILPLTRPVEFIHRTAHDFLVDTESGQAILNYKTDARALLNLHIELAQSWLYLVGFYSQSVAGFVQRFRLVIKQYMRLEDEGASKSAILSMLSVIENLYEAGVMSFDTYRGYLDPPLEVIFGYYFACFEDTLLSHCVRPDTTDLLTTTLQGIAVEDGYRGGLETPVKLIQKMIELGGDPHAIGTGPMLQKDPEYGPSIAMQITTFELFLQTAVTQYYSGHKQHIDKGLLDIIVSLAQTCQDWDRKTLVFYDQNMDNKFIMEPFCQTKPVVFEVDVQFLLIELMHALQESGLMIYSGKLRGVVDSFTSAHVRIRHIRIPRVGNREAFCYRILAQQPFQNIINEPFCSQSATTEMSFSEMVSLLDSFSSSDGTDGASDPRLKSFEGRFVKVSYTEELDSLVEEGLLSRMT
ncbi:hypothetical protein BKA59DRAFT_446560 [Fusarium tricinctum]|uniref:NACHT domain-containing protein n=1 Tax=Fusarium tricinctum TaxID=61284 RepID=A0A8K0RL03_9HYPO|nr:hypothetical protein BKA59DRAFT_446560 [Fusarium tricinctum]